MNQYFAINNSADKPQAELWMGAHPSAPSKLSGNNEDLITLIKNSPREILGQECSVKFNGQLPFLFKILAAGQPLSIQAHPDRDQAIEGFARENNAGIALDAANRNYRDNNHKPEIICAVSEFRAMCGFRKAKNILKFAEQIDHAFLTELCFLLSINKDYRAFFNAFMTVPVTTRKEIIEKAAEWASKKNNPEQIWTGKLIDLYPDDITALSPVYLNLVKLDPGQALYLDAGVLHAYLSGIGIELMANSDNVLRGGLTVKHRDLAELENILVYEEQNIQIIEKDNNTNEYRTPAAEFRLRQMEINGTKALKDEKSPAIILCGDGDVTVSANGENIKISKGQSLFSTPQKTLEITGKGEIYIADIPLAGIADA